MSGPKLPKKTGQQRKAEREAASQGDRDRARLRAEERQRRSKLQGKSLLIGTSGETGLGIQAPQPAESNNLGVY